MSKKKPFAKKDLRTAKTALESLSKTYDDKVVTANEGELHLYQTINDGFTMYKILSIQGNKFFVQVIDNEGKLGTNKFHADKHKFIRSNYQVGDVIHDSISGENYLIGAVALQFDEYVLHARIINNWDTAEEEITNKQRILTNVSGLEIVGFREI